MNSDITTLCAASPLAERIYGVLLATVIGVCLAAALVHWWAA
jgi:hypothetical protein